MSIISALQSAGIFRLQQTWAAVPSNTREQFEEVKRVMAREGNFRNFRKHFRECPPPKIPYIGVHLTDLTFIEDGNKDFLAGGLVNFSKRRRLATILRDIMQNQLTPYNFQEVPFIKDFILNGMGLEEPEVYNLSIGLEAKTGGTVQGKPTVVQYGNLQSLTIILGQWNYIKNS
jgi:son of sevenless-like protein